jgi:hypothetical protein
MANGPAPALLLGEGDRVELERLIPSSSVRAGLAQRARIVLVAADGLSNTAIAEQVGVSLPAGTRCRSLGINPMGRGRPGDPVTIRVQLRVFGEFRSVSQ